MAKIKVFNNDTNRMETYYRGESDAMPYVTNRTLTVGEFRGSSNSPTLWTTKRAMQSWNAQRYLFGSPIPVGFAFKRPYERRTWNAITDYLYTVVPLIIIFLYRSFSLYLLSLLGFLYLSLI